jgi:hypothetical protein
MDYNSLTVAKLKDELKERDIPSTGLKLKKDFVDRLEQHDAETATQDPTSTLPTDDTSTETLTTEKPQTVTSPLTTTDLPPSNEDKPEQETTEPTQETALEQAPSPNSDAMELEPTTASTEPVQTEDAASPDSKKRKRRTPSPQASQDSAHKKQKQETDGPHLPEPTGQDNLHNQVDMPDVPLDQPDLTLQPMSTSDDLVQPFTNDSDKQKATRSPDERRFKNLVTSTDSDPVQPVPEPDDVTVSPAIHPATRALYIRHLVRPINPGALRDHLEDIARPADHSDTSASLVEECYVDALRTHAFVLFTSISAAARARASTHDRIWPSEPMRPMSVSKSTSILSDQAEAQNLAKLNVGSLLTIISMMVLMCSLSRQGLLSFIVPQHMLAHLTLHPPDHEAVCPAEDVLPSPKANTDVLLRQPPTHLLRDEAHW